MIVLLGLFQLCVRVFGHVLGQLGVGHLRQLFGAAGLAPVPVLAGFPAAILGRISKHKVSSSVLFHRLDLGPQGDGFAVLLRSDLAIHHLGILEEVRQHRTDGDVVLGPGSGELRIHRSSQLDRGQLLIIGGFLVLVLLGERVDLLLQFGIVTGGLFQLGELSVTGLDTLTELLDLGFQLCDLGSLCVEVGAGHKALADLLRNCRVNFGGVRIPQYGFQPFQHDCYLLACLLSFLSGQSRCCSAHLVVRRASGIWV